MRQSGPGTESGSGSAYDAITPDRWSIPVTTKTRRIWMWMKRRNGVWPMTVAGGGQLKL